MTVLVTGGAGFIGNHLLRALRRADADERLVSLDRRAPALPVPGVEYLQADLAEPASLADLDLPRDTTCFHLAGLCKEPGYCRDDYFRDNERGTRHLLAACDRLGIDNLIFTSTMMVFAAGERRHSEGDPACPDTAYGASKLAAEAAVLAWSGSGRRARIVRPGVVFGPGEAGNYTRLARALQRSRFAYIGRRSTVKSSIYVKDLVRLLLLLRADAGPHALYHAVWPEPVTIEQIVAAICAAHGWTRRIPTVPYPLAYLAALPFVMCDPQTCAVHPRRIQKLYRSTDISAKRLRDLPFAPEYSLEEAVQDWLRESGSSILS